MLQSKSELNQFFNKQSGSNEAYLFLKINNPFLAEKLDEISLVTITQAQQLDQVANQQFELDLVELITQISSLKPNEESEKILKLKTELDLCYHRCSRLAGDQMTHKSSIITLINVLMSSIWKSAEGDMKAEEKLSDEENARQLHFDLLEFPLIAEILAEDSVIAADDLVPVMLFQSKEFLSLLFPLFLPEQQQDCLLTAKNLLLTSDYLNDVEYIDVNKKIDFLSSLID